MSVIKKRYFLKLIGRIIIFILAFALCFYKPEVFSVLEGWNFFKEFSPLHILWIMWFVDMILQVLPNKSKIALGSKKLFANHFRPVGEKINSKALKKYINSVTKSAYKVMLMWVLFIAVIGVLYFSGVINKVGLFIISVGFYVCDLICVIIWCPFRYIMKNKCCTTCRIFNWDHLMMFSPLIFMGGFFAISLVVMAFVVWFVWELSVVLYPERFWEKTNVALKCSECTDKLCIQHCKKLR